MVVVVYDIADDKRRLKLSNFLEGQGRRVQESVFECFVSLGEMRQLYQQVKLRVKADEDNVRFYWVTREAVSQVLVIGSTPPEEPPNAYII